MTGTTDNLGLTLIDDIDEIDPDVLSDNFKKIDDAVGADTGISGDWTWTKNSDGTADCFMESAVSVSTTTKSGNIYRSASTTFNFPITFSEVPYVFVQPASSSNTLWSSLVKRTPTSMTMYYMSADNLTHSGVTCSIWVHGKVS